ncbi:hypothetical protein QJS10_CPB19g02022 [Acorus calamus]|uniref:Uncharacterized protein n=1 Tax=Acorus calamus TaxID=4465 RepID=A0AAV9CFG4_ACOCL|nr:hypothetical protein QJS10_CPB19g02022 [Acorus calamus]
MLCLKAEVLNHEMYASHGVILPVNLGGSMQQRSSLLRGLKGSRASNRSSSSGDGSATSSALEDVKSSASKAREKKSGIHYRSKLEKDVEMLQRQLEEEINLHIALENAIGHSSAPFPDSPCQLPAKAQELLTNIAVLELTVLKLEEELVSLHCRLSQLRNERQISEFELKHQPSPKASSLSGSSCSVDPNLYHPRISDPCNYQMLHSSQSEPDTFSSCKDPQSPDINGSVVFCSREEIYEPCIRCIEGKNTVTPLLKMHEMEQLNKNLPSDFLWQHPNQLSEEMVRCMRNIFLCLADSSTVPCKVSFECMPSHASPCGHLSYSSFASISDSSMMTSVAHSPSTELLHNSEVLTPQNSFDPYGVHGKVKWKNIGSYSSASEVSWMAVGKKQLEYAAEALKRFRLLVEQLEKVNPAHLSCNERLAFWINLYNALIMHAYLAYGLPRSDIKLFSLMQKAAYTVGGHSFSAVDIEYIILKMKPPAHRPQIALVLALHKFKISEEQREYSIDDPEPLVSFALSCGMYSSPTVRIYTAKNIRGELQDSLKDYVRASVGISDKGKLIVPKLLHCFAKGIVEDSLLVDWICRFLSHEQVATIRESTSKQKQRLLGARSFSVIPFDSRFRYLFLPENSNLQRSF